MIDLYCERTAPGLFGEPLNAVSNLAFLCAAWLTIAHARRVHRCRVDIALLAGLVAVVGVCSLLFHLTAERWAGRLDSLSILFFVLIYLVLFSRRALHYSVLRTVGLIILTLVLSRLGGVAGSGLALNGTENYAGFLLVALLLSRLAGARASRRLLQQTTGTFALAMAFRALDLHLCPSLPSGTHFLWHLCNGIVCYLAMRAYLAELTGPRTRAEAPQAR